MDYEKKYNEAMLRADEAVQKGCLDKDMFDIIFPPEESEDERIRKWLVNYFSTINETVWIHMDITCEQILAYLEKQKEQSLRDFIDDFPYSDQKEQKPAKDGEDERIRKEIISLVLKVMGQEKDNLSDNKYDAMLSWLEKQKEPENTSASVIIPSCWECEQKEQKPVDDSDFKTKLAEYMMKNRTGYSYNISSESILQMAKEELLKRGVVVKKDEK